MLLLLLVHLFGSAPIVCFLYLVFVCLCSVSLTCGAMGLSMTCE